MIEFDPAKDAANIAKHGVSLALAAEFDVDRAVVIEDRRRDYGEVRLIAFGYVDGTLFALTFTDRRGTIRAISLRRAGAREVRRWLSK
jgi:hypothetical protein